MADHMEEPPLKRAKMRDGKFPDEVPFLVRAFRSRTPRIESDRSKSQCRFSPLAGGGCECKCECEWSVAVRAQESRVFLRE